MPLLKSDYTPKSPLFKNGHFASIYPTQFRRIKLSELMHQQRFTTPDDDFIDADLSENRHNRVAFLFHGFEGNARRPYMKGMTRHLLNSGWDVVAANHRGCSGEPNRRPRAYHAGDYADMAFLIEEILGFRAYTQIALIGFSLGGNIVLNYLAKYTRIPANIIGGVSISVPIDLRTAVFEIMKRKNLLYNRDFYQKLVRKIKEKEKIYPDLMPYDEILKAQNIDEFDEFYTAPYHGFENATDYRIKSSALFVLEDIQRPCLLLQAQNDPFLSESCYPYDQASASKFLHLLTPRYGGHCGFWMSGGVYYHEKQTAQFLERLT